MNIKVELIVDTLNFSFMSSVEGFFSISNLLLMGSIKVNKGICMSTFDVRDDTSILSFLFENECVVFINEIVLKAGVMSCQLLMLIIKSLFLCCSI